MRHSFHLILAGLLLLALALVGLGANSVAAESPNYHTVGWGETLFSIAARYGTSVNAIMQANNIRNADFIFIGQRLMISGNMPGPLPSPGTYTVQNGDTLFSIATRYGTSVSAVMQLNRLYNYFIYPGQVLRVSGYTPILIPPGPIPGPMPGHADNYYVVRPGDYLASIAYRYGSTDYAIRIANRLPNSNFVWAGQRLLIPGGGVNPGSNPIPGPLYGSIPPEINPGLPPYPGYPSMPPYVPPMATPAVIVIPYPSPVPNPDARAWEAVLITNTKGTGPCSLATIVVGKRNWPVVVATTDGSWISDPKLTGTKPERGPYVVEFAHACTGTWRVIPLGLNAYADVTLSGGHAEVEFHPRP